MYKKKHFHILYVKWNIISFTYNGRRTNEQFLLPWKFILLKKKKKLIITSSYLQREINEWKFEIVTYDTFTLNEIFHLENKIVRLALIVTSVTCNRYRSLFVNIFLEWRAAETSVAKKPKHRYVCAEKQGGIETPNSG